MMECSIWSWAVQGGRGTSKGKHRAAGALRAWQAAVVASGGFLQELDLKDRDGEPGRGVRRSDQCGGTAPAEAWGGMHFRNGSKGSAAGDRILVRGHASLWGRGGGTRATEPVSHAEGFTHEGIWLWACQGLICILRRSPWLLCGRGRVWKAGPVRKRWRSSWWETVAVEGWTELKRESAGLADRVVAERVDADREGEGGGTRDPVLPPGEPG